MQVGIGNSIGGCPTRGSGRVAARPGRKERGEELYETIVNEAMNGRMTWPQEAAGLCLDRATLSPRFGVEQGLKADGSLRIRPIDDLTRSGCNAATSPSEKLQYESLDTLLAVGRAAGEAFGHDLSLWKADIASAYRRIPVAPEHRQTVRACRFQYGWPDNGIATPGTTFWGSGKRPSLEPCR